MISIFIPKRTFCEVQRSSSKKKVALLFGYLGTNYKGLQKQTESNVGRSVEDKLETSLFKNGYITESNYGKLEKISWSRSSRTDAGVHALKNVVSFKMEIPTSYNWELDPFGQQFAHNINLSLSDDIRVFGVTKAPQSFRARNQCENRTYHYLIPYKYLNFMDINDLQHNILNLFIGNNCWHNFSRSWTTPLNALHFSINPLIQEDQQNKEEEEEEKETSSLLLYDRQLQIKNYSNIRNKSNLFRNIQEFKVTKQININNEQWLLFSIKSNGFLYHQIRKIISTVVACTNNMITPQIVKMKIHSPFKFVIPLAPPSYLYLYQNEFVTNRYLPLSLFPYSVSSFISQIDDFKETVLYPHITSASASHTDWELLIDLWKCNKIEDQSNLLSLYNTWKIQFDQQKEEKILKFRKEQEDLKFVDNNANKIDLK